MHGDGEIREGSPCLRWWDGQCMGSGLETGGYQANAKNLLLKDQLPARTLHCPESKVAPGSRGSMHRQLELVTALGSWSYSV